MICIKKQMELCFSGMLMLLLIITLFLIETHIKNPILSPKMPLQFLSNMFAGIVSHKIPFILYFCKTKLLFVQQKQIFLINYRSVYIKAHKKRHVQSIISNWTIVHVLFRHISNLFYDLFSKLWAWRRGFLEFRCCQWLFPSAVAPHQVDNDVRNDKCSSN